MAILKGEVTFKVKFKDLQVAIGYGMTSAIINHECAEQIYARSSWSKIRDRKKSNFEVEIIDKNIERN